MTRLCWEDWEQRAPVCGVEGLAEPAWPAHITAITLHCATEKLRPQDGSCNEMSQNLIGKSHGFPSHAVELNGIPLMKALRQNNFMP